MNKCKFLRYKNISLTNNAVVHKALLPTVKAPNLGQLGI